MRDMGFYESYAGTSEGRAALRHVRQKDPARDAPRVEVRVAEGRFELPAKGL